MADSILDLLEGLGEGSLSDEEGSEFIRRLLGDAPVGEPPSTEQLGKEAGESASRVSREALQALSKAGLLDMGLLAVDAPLLGLVAHLPAAIGQTLQRRAAQKLLDEYLTIAGRREAEKATARNVNQKMAKELSARPSDHPTIQRELDLDPLPPPGPGSRWPDLRGGDLRFRGTLDDFEGVVAGNRPGYPRDAYWEKAEFGEGFIANRGKIDDFKKQFMREGFDPEKMGGPVRLDVKADTMPVQRDFPHRLRALRELIEEGAIDPKSVPGIPLKVHYGAPVGARSGGRDYGFVDTPSGYIPRSLGPIPTREAGQVANLEAAVKGAKEAELKFTPDVAQRLLEMLGLAR